MSESLSVRSSGNSYQQRDVPLAVQPVVAMLRHDDRWEIDMWRIKSFGIRSGRSAAVRGFTLIELIVTIAIVAILSSLALPSFREVSINMTTSSTANELLAALNLARAEAVKRGVDVRLAANGGVWNTGWQIQADSARDSSFSTVLRTYAAVPATFTITAKANGAGGQDGLVVFAANGAIKPSSGVGSDINVCRPAQFKKDPYSRRVTIGQSGISSARRDTTGSTAPACP